MLLDTNIIIYAINTASPKHTKAQQFIREYQSKLAIAHQNIFEALRVLTHPNFPSPLTVPKAIQAVENIAEALHIIFPTFETHHLATELIKKYHLTADKVFDAYLVATAITNGIETIATDNTKDFQLLTEVETHNPFLTS